MSTSAAVIVEWEGRDHYDDVVMADPYSYSDGPTASIDMSLFMACRDGNIEEVRRLLKSGSAVNVEDHTARTPIHVACRKKHPSIVAVLIEAGANVNVQDIFGISPLNFAVSAGNLELVDLLLEHKADPNAIDCDGRSILSRAVTNKTVWDKLVAAGAEVDSKTKAVVKAKAEELDENVCYG